jgi:hypothetical protein
VRVLLACAGMPVRWRIGADAQQLCCGSLLSSSTMVLLLRWRRSVSVAT